MKFFNLPQKKKKKRSKHNPTLQTITSKTLEKIITNCCWFLHFLTLLFRL